MVAISDPARRFILLARACALLAILIGCVALAGWRFNIVELRQAYPGTQPMQAWAAAASLPAGVALWLSTAASSPARRLLGAILAGLVASFALFAIVGHLLAPAPAPPIPIAAYEFLLVAVLLASEIRVTPRGDGVRTALASLGALVALMVIVAHVYAASPHDVEDLFRLATPSCAAVLLLLFMGIVFAHPGCGWLRLLRSGNLGGVAARRLVVPVVGVPLGVGWGLASLGRLLAWTPELCLAIYAGAALSLLLAVVFTITRQVARIDTARRRAVALARHHKERLAFALEVAGAGVWDWDLVADRCTWSDSYFSLFGYDRAVDAPSHRAFFARVHPDDQPAIRTVMERIACQGGPFQCEYRIVLPDGMVHHMETLGHTKCGRDGKPSRISGINIDVSQRVAMTTELAAAKLAAERANVAKSKFLAAASHDLRQPAQSLALFVGLLTDRLAGTPGQAALEGIQRSVEALRQLLDGLLDVSRLDAGIIKPKVVDVALGPMLTALAAEYGPRAELQNLRLRCVATSAVARTDAQLLDRMVRNLVENALRYTKRGGIVVGCRRRGGQVSLAVYDSGIGISADEQRQIFEEFYQIGNPERDRRKGVGLGLSIVDRLAHLLGHQVSLRSRLGRGSCFAIVMPAGVAAPPDRAPIIIPPPRKPCGHDLILVIEDEDLVRAGLGAALCSWGYDVSLAASTAEAVAAAGAALPRRPRLLISDYRLCGCEVGTMAIEAVRRRCGTAIPGLIITGDTAPERLKEATGAGFELVHKPFSVEQLRGVVDNLVRD